MQAVALAEEREPLCLAEALGYLGEVRAARGETAEAIRVLERAERIPRTLEKSSRDLAKLRRQHFPHLASCASVDAYLRGDIHGDTENGADPLADLARVREALAEGPRAARGHLEARFLERYGRIAEALRIAEGLLAGDARAEPELVRAAAGWTARQGRVEAALEIIEGRFAASGDPSLDPWVSWARIGSEGGLGLSELSARLVRAPADPAPASDRPQAAADVRWLFEELRTRGIARLNCGGPEYLDSSGKEWGHDRFFDGGQAYGNPRPEMGIKEDRDLYYDHRRFLHGDWARNAYRIPVPGGLYELHLLICATDPRPETRRFRLAVKGTTVRECIDLEEDPGIGRALTETLKVRVTDGAIDILLEPFPGSYAVVNAIELRLLGEGDGGG